MILTDYYKMAKLPEVKSKLRIDCTASTKSYPEFETMRNKKEALFFFFGDVPDSFSGNAKRKADKALTKTKSISSIYVPDIQTKCAYGDMVGTLDALLFIFNNDYSEIEIFIARGQKNNVRQLYNLFSDGELNNEIEQLRKQAVTDLVTQ
jgi:hypothetical protein